MSHSRINIRLTTGEVFVAEMGASLFRKIRASDLKKRKEKRKRKKKDEWAVRRRKISVPVRCDGPLVPGINLESDQLWNGKPRLACVTECSTYTFENVCRCTALDMPEPRDMTEQMDWREKEPPQMACVSDDLEC